MHARRWIGGLRRKSIEAFFRLTQRAGLNITPNHYYMPIADINYLSRTKHIWAKPSALAGIEMKVDRQIEFLRRTCLPYQHETIGNTNFRYATEHGFGPGYGYIEAQALHGIIRSLKPRRIIEVGSGVSTYCMKCALDINKAEDGRDYELICVEPFPSQRLAQMDVRIEKCMVETLPPSFFDQLEDGDLLFIDSSHAVRIGGDVIHLYLEVIPRLKSGVYIHIHDIFLPYTYNVEVLHSYFQWSETALLQALLVNNDELHTAVCLSQLHYEAPDALKQVFPEYDPKPLPQGLLQEGNRSDDCRNKHFPASLYLRTGSELP